MGSKRQAAEHGADGGVQGRSRRGQSSAAASRADAHGGVSAGERLDAGQDGEGVEHAGVVDADARLKSYRRLRLKAEAALELLITANGVPANVRAAAVRTALELVGAIGAKAKAQEEQELSGDELDPETLTIEGIDREIHRLGRV